MQYYGTYPYSYGDINHLPCQIPSNSYLEKIVEKVKLVYPNEQFNSVMITKFVTGRSHIPPHSDNELMIDPSSNILTVSLGTPRTLKFQPRKGVKSSEVTVTLKHGSAYIMSHKSQKLFV
ncbi:MAG: alpha-ketoglutarate-dependent dioxygenase AlkB, partial [Gammaproteobacteria bacterium]|nr:alpha-ketoglutarate-dependent dioxygenase AlkB [Gammaproteobacteria bacterium]